MVHSNNSLVDPILALFLQPIHLLCVNFCVEKFEENIGDPSPYSEFKIFVS